MECKRASVTMCTSLYLYFILQGQQSIRYMFMSETKLFSLYYKAVITLRFTTLYFVLQYNTLHYIYIGLKYTFISVVSAYSINHKYRLALFSAIAKGKLIESAYLIWQSIQERSKSTHYKPDMK